MTSMLTLAQINQASPDQFVSLLDGTYEHSPWVAERAAHKRPYLSLAQLKRALVESVRQASRAEQLQLICAHPELAGKAMVSGTLTTESTGEQSRAGLTHCSPQEFEQLQQLNRDYQQKFGFPFILAVRGARGLGLSRQEIISTFARRLQNSVDFERNECLRNIHRIAEIRLNDKFGYTPTQGNQVWDMAQDLAAESEPGYLEKGELTVTYLTPAHQACAKKLQSWMLEFGFDEASIDAVGNVVGRYRSQQAGAKTLLTGSHFDTVRNAGKYDGRVGIFVPMVCVKALHSIGQRLPFDIEVVAFAEEEGQRFPVTFLGSAALTGGITEVMLNAVDSSGISVRQAMQAAGLPADLQVIQGLQRDASEYLGFVEVHIEQGPVLCEEDLPLGIVTSINGSVRYQCQVIGTASHAGTTPMNRRQDAAAAVAELSVYMEQRAAQDGDSVATIGVLQVPNGSINVIPARCHFTLDIRAPSNAQRDRLSADIGRELAAICQRRGVVFEMKEILKASAAPSDQALQTRWEQAVASLGLPVFHLPSGAGHDAMKIHEIMPQAMLFLRGGNAGISHNPLEISSNDDLQLCVDAFMHVLQHLASR